MSMLRVQVDGLREAANRMEEIGISVGHSSTASAFITHDAVERMREAADTIEGLQGRLQELQSEVNHWKVEQTHAYSNWEDAHNRVKELEANNSTRWYELFGTPERAARTLLKICDEVAYCSECPMFWVCSKDKTPKFDDYDAFLKWLRSN